MQSLQEYFQNQLPHIENCLQKNLQELNPLIRPIASHILEAGGKRLRPILCILTAQALGYSGRKIYPLACALEMVHSASLLHDDVLDSAEFRRSKKAAHLIFGVSKSILTGDALLAMANRLVTTYGNIELVNSISEAVYRTALGEVLEIEKMEQPVLSRDEYLEIVIGKTAFLIQTCCESGAIMAGSDASTREAAKDFGLNLGIAFQLVDDALDYSVSPNNIGKPLGGDLREGKLTLPLIFFLQGMQEKKREKWLSKVKQGNLSQEELEWVLMQIEEQKLGQKAREEAGLYLQKAGEALKSFPEGRNKQYLQEILEYIRVRDS